MHHIIIGISPVVQTGWPEEALSQRSEKLTSGLVTPQLQNFDLLMLLLSFFFCRGTSSFSSASSSSGLPVTGPETASWCTLLQPAHHCPHWHKRCIKVYSVKLAIAKPCLLRHMYLWLELEFKISIGLLASLMPLLGISSFSFNSQTKLIFGLTEPPLF